MVLGVNYFFLSSSCHSRDPGVRVSGVRQHGDCSLDSTGARFQDRSLHPGTSAHKSRGSAPHQRGVPLDGGGGDPGDGVNTHR